MSSFQKTAVPVSFMMIAFLMSTPAYAGKNEAKAEIAALNKTIQEAGDKGDLQAAIDAAEKALDIANREFGPKKMETAKALINVANLYMYAEDAAAAERLYKNAILIQVEHGDDKSLDLADTYYNLAMAYAVQKKYDEARKMLNKALAIQVDRLGETHESTQKTQKALNEIWGET